MLIFICWKKNDKKMKKKFKEKIKLFSIELVPILTSTKLLGNEEKRKKKNSHLNHELFHDSFSFHCCFHSYYLWRWMILNRLHHFQPNETNDYIQLLILLCV